VIVRPASEVPPNPNNPYDNLTPLERWYQVARILAEALPKLSWVTPQSKLETPSRTPTVDRER
jgi:hypothetical protein